MVVSLVEQGNYETEEGEDMNSIIGYEADQYLKELHHEGRILGQMVLQRLPPLVMPKELREKIGKMTKSKNCKKRSEREILDDLVLQTQRF